MDNVLKWGITSKGEFGYFVEMFVDEKEARDRFQEHLEKWVLKGTPIVVEGDNPDDLRSATRIQKQDDPKSEILLKPLKAEAPYI